MPQINQRTAVSPVLGIDDISAAVASALGAAAQANNAVSAAVTASNEAEASAQQAETSSNTAEAAAQQVAVDTAVVAKNTKRVVSLASNVYFGS